MMNKHYRRMLDNELQILKSITINISEDKVAMLLYLYHSNCDCPRLNHRGYYLFIANPKDLETTADKMIEEAVKPWTLPYLTDKVISYQSMGHIYDKSAFGGHWLKLKLKKAINLSTAWKIMGGYNFKTGLVNLNAAYGLKNYSHGSETFDLSEEKLKSLEYGIYISPVHLTKYIQNPNPSIKRYKKVISTAISVQTGDIINVEVPPANVTK